MSQTTFSDKEGVFMNILKCHERDRRSAEVLYNGIAAYQKQISVPNCISLKELAADVLDQNPELFHVRGFEIVYGLFGSALAPMYTFSKAEYTRLLNECAEEADYIAEKVKKLKLSQYETALKVHDILAKRVKYVLFDSVEHHSIIGALLNQEGCCEGIAKSYKFILERLDIPCICISGTGIDSIRGISGSHMWNMICIDGSWCHVDATYDLPFDNMKFVSHAYFGLDDIEISSTHKYNSRLYPAATTPQLSYFNRKKTIISDEQALCDYICNYIKCNVFCFDVKLSPAYMAADIEQSVSDVISRALRLCNLYTCYRIVSDKNSRVFCINIEKK